MTCHASGWASMRHRTAYRSRGSRPMAGSASCCPDARSTESRRWMLPTRSTASCARTRPAVSRGWTSSGAGLGGVLADDMGLGKTVQLLALLAYEQNGGPLHLLVCPMSLVGNWQREAANSPRLRVHIHHGAERARGSGFTEAIAGCDLVITTYALAARDAADLRKITWRRVVVDEAQAIKNAATKQATAIRSIPAGTRIAVTGTPVENRLADLWSILEFANPGLLGSATAFKKRAEPIERRGDDEAADRLRASPGRSSCAASRPISRSSPTCPRSWRWTGLQLDWRAGRALSGGGRRHAGTHPCGGGNRAAGARPGHDDQAQAGVQPSSALPPRRKPAGRAFGQARTTGRDSR